MNKIDVYVLFDRECGPFLLRQGFSKIDAGEYARATPAGSDRIMADALKGAGRFAVMMSFYPNELEFVHVISSNNPQEPRGFPVGPYLGFQSVSRREYVWAVKPESRDGHSLSHVTVALAAHGLPWLDALRDPVFFSKSVDPAALTYAGAAFERAGDTAAAREAYEQMYSRLVSALAGGIPEGQYIKQAGKLFVLVAKKLGRDQERVKRFEEQLGWSCDASALDS